MSTSRELIPLLILGAGMSGLGAGIQARRTGIDSVILEAETEVGGLCRSLTSRTGCDFDFGPKILILDDSDNSADLLSFLGNNCQKYLMQENVYLKQFGLIDFPIQRNLIDLPSDISKLVIDEVKHSTKHNIVRNYRDWLLMHYGEYLTNNILLPYEEKKWQIDLDKLDYTWALSRPVSVSLSEMELGAKQKLSPNKHYYYPRNGNITTLTQSIAKKAGKILLNHKVGVIDTSRRVVFAGNKEFCYDRLISILPLDYMLKITKGNDFDRIKKSASVLQQLSIRIFHLVFEGNHSIEGTAIYFPEKDFIFRRVSVLQNLCPALARKGYTPISVEVSLNNDSKYISEESMQKIVFKQLRSIKQFKKLGEPIECIVQYIPYAYPLPTIGLKDFVKDVHDYYNKYQVYLCGRGGNYDYCNSDKAYKQGKETVLSALQQKES